MESRLSKLEQWSLGAAEERLGRLELSAAPPWILELGAAPPPPLLAAMQLLTAVRIIAFYTPSLHQHSEY